ncbi:MAG TPA: YegS/Rv2252/BmrU family lipid kinase [Candidatus Acidoferrum sp.]|nr:YegS/Rv2252/BmrU family lipid kinase [Candidatus Acidoferrum sp.]
MRKGLLLYNPAAGRVPVRPFVHGIIRPLTSSGWQIEVVETLSGRHATQVAHQAALEKYDAVFAIGGDGTVGQVASGLMNSETALAVLPAGTMNVWAAEVGIPVFDWLHNRALQQNARMLVNSKTYRVDVGVCNGQVFLLWAGIGGLDAIAVNQMEPRPRFAKYLSVPQYAAATVWNAAIWHGMDLRVWADNQRLDGHFLLAVATNIRRYIGGIAVLSPNAYVDDGEMDMWLFSGDNVAVALRHFVDLFSGRHLSSDQARRLPFHSVRVESDTAFSMHVDGEPLLGGNRAEIQIQKQALRVIVPSKAIKLLKEQRE